MNTKKAVKTYIYILIFLVFSLSFLFNNKTIEKEKTSKSYETKALDQEGQNYRLVTSADNVQVPVPKGYVASSIEGENYVRPKYQHTYIPYKGTYTELTWSSPVGEQYPWTQDSNGIWLSGNQGIPNSTCTLESEEFDYIKGTTLTINYTISSCSGDYLNIDLINLTNNTTSRVIYNRYGNYYNWFDYTNDTETYTMIDGGTGRYKIRAIYSKNGSVNEGLDTAYIKASTYFKEDENGNTINVDQKTKVHDGGFVIYQLTDAELETDPNGTVVAINDTNKDTAQRTRNQYVWVPVPNIEDITRTKTSNNGIMQFGQGYYFYTTSIRKENDTWSDSYREPRLIYENDKTKFELQRYSNINKRDNYLNKMQEEYNRMIKTIKTYKGYYIGRYETGDDYTHSYSKNYFTKPRVVRYNSNINYVNWYECYKVLERLSGKTEKYVETGMLYDSLWDYTLKWLNETGTRSYKDINTDCGTWGNYTNNTKTVTSGGTTPAGTGAIETITYIGETFSDSPTSSNNIFDLAGNIYEWTKSGSYGSRRVRGSGFESATNHSAVSNYSNWDPDYRENYIRGTRSVLFIK